MTLSPSISSSSGGGGPIGTWLVSGFLGAGKTTFILDQLQRKGARIAVLVNEFGELGIDGALIREKGGIGVVEMPGGCICCSQKQGVAESIQQIASKLQPELLLIEPSGIAETSELLGVLTAPSLSQVIRLDTAIAILDAETFLEYSEQDVFGSFFLDQIVQANLVLVNKTDLVGEAELAAVEQRVARINPNALVQRTALCRMVGEPPKGGNIDPSDRRAPLPAMQCVSVAPGAELTASELELFLEQLSSGAFGHVLRGKGFLTVRGQGGLNLQIVSGRVRLEAFRTNCGPRLTLIGYGLDGERLRAFFGKGQKESNR